MPKIKILKQLDLPVSKEKFTGDITKDLLAIREILIHIPAEFANVKYMRLKEGHSIKRHKKNKDKKLIRIHIPLQTAEHVHFYLWDKDIEKHYNLEKGKYYYVDVSKDHAIHNKSTTDMLHLVVDCYINPKLEDLLKQADEFDICSPIGF